MADAATNNYQAPEGLGTYATRALFVGVAGLVLALVISHLTGGAWGLVTRRVFEAATRTLPVVAVLFLPVVAALFVHDHGHALYEWTNHELVRNDPALRHKSKYLIEWFF